MLFIAIFVILFLQRSFLLAVVAVAVVGYIVTIGLKPYALPVVLLFYLCIAPIHYIGKDLEFYKVYYYASLTPLFLFTMAIIFILERAIILIRHEQNLHAQCPPYKFDIESILLIFLGIWIIFQMLRGFSLGYDSTVIRGEVVEMSPIFGYFIWSTVVRGSKHTTIWLQLFLLAAVITSCVFILSLIHI